MEHRTWLIPFHFQLVPQANEFGHTLKSNSLSQERIIVNIILNLLNAFRE